MDKDFDYTSLIMDAGQDDGDLEVWLEAKEQLINMTQEEYNKVLLNYSAEPERKFRDEKDHGYYINWGDGKKNHIPYSLRLWQRVLIFLRIKLPYRNLLFLVVNSYV